MHSLTRSKHVAALSSKRIVTTVAAIFYVLAFCGCGHDGEPSAGTQKAAGSATDGGAVPSGPQAWVPGTPTVLTIPIDLPTATPAPRIVLSNVDGQPGAIVDLQAVLFTAGSEIAAAQIDISFPDEVSILANANGHPQCTVNPDIDKNATAFAFRPGLCNGSPCQMVRAIVLSLSSLDAIADGSLLFSCKVQLGSRASGVFPFLTSNVGLSTPDGVYIAGGGVDGSAQIAGDPLPTSIPMSPTASATPAPQDTPTSGVTLTSPAIELNQSQGAAGEVVRVTATLRLARDEDITALQDDLCIPAGVTLAAKANGAPDCDVNPAIMKENTTFTFQPSPYSPASCPGVRAIVISFGTINDSHLPIADGALLYTCNVRIDDDAQGSLTLHMTNIVGSNRDGLRTPELDGIDGAIDVTS